MKNVLCYLGIIFLLFLIVLPPVLRIVLNDKEEEVEEAPIVRKTLSCDSDIYLTRSSYENDVIKTVIIKKIEVKEDTETSDSKDITDNEEESGTDNRGNQESQDEESVPDTNETPSPNENPDNEEKTEFDKIFDKLSKDSQILKQEAEDGLIVQLDFSASDYNGLLLDDLRKNIDEEKIYYESQKMTCSIIE